MSEDVYPVVIFTSRYGGCYEGAPWIALNEHTDDEAIEDAQGDDGTCANFFHTYKNYAPIGRGTTPDQAYQDLKRHLEEDPERTWPHHHYPKRYL